MKKIQITLACIAILVASAGVFANARTVLGTTYYRAPDALFNTPGALCAVVVANPGCPDTGTAQCPGVYITTLPGEAPSPKTYFISKIIDNGSCITVKRPS